MCTARYRTSSERERGFTLIELLVVVVIVGVLAAIAVPVFLGQRKKGIDASLKADVRSLAQQMEDYTVEHSSAVVFGTVDPVTQLSIRSAIGSTSPYRFAISGDNILFIRGGPAQGYCIRAHNTSSSASTYSRPFWYDSTRGGLRPGGPQSLPNTGACVGTSGWIQIT